MEQFHLKTKEYFNLTDWTDMFSSMATHCWVILPIALPVLCLAIYGLFSMIKAGHVAPVYVINLLLSDVLQVCTKPIALSMGPSGLIFEILIFFYASSLLACIGFMMCIAGERYIMVAHPLWYRFHRTVKKSILYSALVWMTAFIVTGGITLASAAFVVEIDKVSLFLALLHLLPYPVVMFCFVGTWRALSKSTSVSPGEQKQIMRTLALVLFIYTVFFLPYIFLMMVFLFLPKLMHESVFQQFSVMTSTLLSVNPLADPILYVFMRSKKLLIWPCSRHKRNQLQAHQELSVGHEESQV